MIIFTLVDGFFTWASIRRSFDHLAITRVARVSRMMLRSGQNEKKIHDYYSSDSNRF